MYQPILIYCGQQSKARCYRTLFLTNTNNIFHTKYFLRKYHIIEQRKINAALDLIVEIWSPANKKKECDAKHNL